MKRLAAPWLAALLLLAVAAPALGASRTIALTPKTINPGQRASIFGSGWKGKVDLLVGPTNSEAEKVLTVRPDSRGKIFTQKYIVNGGTEEGTYVLLACQKDCAVKVSARFTVKRTLF